jgi:hypothetical protein
MRIDPGFVGMSSYCFIVYYSCVFQELTLESRRFAKLDHYVTERMALLLSKRHGRHGRGNGMKHIIMSGNRLGLVSPSGNVRYGRPRHAVE